MSSRVTRVSVPGKLILMGEHAAVYGRPALVTAIGLRMSVRLESRPDDRVEILLPDLGSRAELSWAEIREAADSARRAWDAYASDPRPERFRALRPDRPESLVAVALGEAARASGSGDGPGSGLRVRLESEIPVGSGFGSSAAAAVGVVTACLARRGDPIGWSAVDPVAREVERRQHGFPSGIDSATVYHGGVVWCRPGSERLAVEPLPARPEALRCFHVYDTGPPSETTGRVVAEVRSLRDRDVEAFDGRLESMREATERLRDMLVDAACPPDDLSGPVRAYQRLLDGLGVVPPRVRELVAEIEEAGGAAKISGAGALSGAGAGSLLVLHPEPDSIGGLAGLRRYEVDLGVEGTRVESVG